MINIRPKTSPMWKISIEKLTEIVNINSSFTDILKYFGLSPHGGNIKTLKRRLIYDNINFDHILIAYKKNRGKSINKVSIPLSEILIENSSYSRNLLKKRLIKNNLLKPKCDICGLEPFWNNEKLVLVLDHINGIHNDNKIENLRLLCPNCNSQTDTFAGRNLRKQYNCNKCDKIVDKKNSLCEECRNDININKRKCERPSPNVLLQQIKELGFCGTARLYNVSDNAIRKWCKSYNLPYRTKDLKNIL